MVFIDLEKMYDWIPRDVFRRALEKKGVKIVYIKTIQDMHDEVLTKVRTTRGETKKNSYKNKPLFI